MLRRVSAPRGASLRRVRDPFVYTPGDNEWTDCHRAKFGGFVPTERLEVNASSSTRGPSRRSAATRRSPCVRSRWTLPEHADYVENVTWTQSDVVF